MDAPGQDIAETPDVSAFVTERTAAPEPFLARPIKGEPDWEALAADVRRRFPKTLARLAE